MTLAALLMKDTVFAKASRRLQYAALGVLFVNISIGGTLTPFAAPPVLMVSGVWGWDFDFMLNTFGWKAALAVLVNATICAVVLRPHVIPAAEQAGAAGAQVAALALALSLGAEVIIAGCTEIPLVLTADDIEGELVSSTALTLTSFRAFATQSV